MEDKINFIRDKCIEANPDIVELKFGCEVKTRHGNKQRVITYDSYHILLADVFGTEVIKRGDIDEIIGRPIRLAGILLAIGNKTIWDVRFSSGDFLTFWNIDDHRGDWMWNLRADDLREQSDQTINFLYELLQ